jgi:hypothetical protein
MPEAAISEYGETRVTEDEIGTAGEWLMPTPAGDAGGAKDGRELKLGIFVAA